MTPGDSQGAPHGLYERERELATIDRLIDDAAAGNGRIALIEGPAGIGKSRLLRAARHRAAEGGRVTVMHARCSELERDFSFGTVRQLFESAGAEQAVPHLRGNGNGNGAELTTPDDAQQAEGSFAALHALYWATLELGESQPLLLAIDDVQWSDVPSLRFVDYLAHRIERAPVLLVLALRSTDPGTDAALIADIATDPLCETIRPAPLGATAVAALVNERLGTADPAFLAACEEAAAGNPLLLHHLLTALEDEGVRPSATSAGVVRRIGSRAIARVVLSRLARLPAASAAVARGVATLGESSSIPALATLTGLDESTVAHAATALTRAEILRGEAPFGFVHALVRDAVYQDVAAGDRELAHARAATLLRAAGASEDEVAAQLVHAARRGDPETVTLLRAAARRALQRGGPESAVAYLRRALEEPPPPGQRVTVQIELGLAAADWNAPTAVEYLQPAYEQLEDPFQRMRATAALAVGLMFVGGATEAGQIARRAADALPDALEDERQGLQALAMMTVFFGGDPTAALELADGYTRLPPNAGYGARYLAAVVAFMWAAGGRRPLADSEALILAALDDGALRETADGFVWSVVIMSLHLCGSERTKEFADQARSVAYRRGSSFAYGTIEQWRGCHLLNSDLPEAGDALRQAVALQATWGTDVRGGTWARAYLCRCAIAVGELDGAREALGAEPYEQDTSDGSTLWRAAAGELALAEERWDDALVLARHVKQAAPHNVNPDWQPWRSVAARALAGLRRREEALATMREELEIARRVASEATVGRCLRELGEMDEEDGIALLREAVATLEDTFARFDLARALVALGTRLVARGDRDEAVAALLRGRDLAFACGSPPVVAAAERQLASAGVEDMPAYAVLTPQERRIAELAATGRSDRDIAFELLLTPEAVDRHLATACTKLALSSRDELRAALA